MVVGRNNGVVGLTGFSDKKMSGLLFGPQKSGRNNGVVVWRGSTVFQFTDLEPSCQLRSNGQGYQKFDSCQKTHLHPLLP